MRASLFLGREGLIRNNVVNWQLITLVIVQKSMELIATQHSTNFSTFMYVMDVSFAGHPTRYTGRGSAVQSETHAPDDDWCILHTAENFNCRMEEFELGYMEVKDRPTLLTQKNLRSKGSLLKQKGITFKEL